VRSIEFRSGVVSHRSVLVFSIRSFLPLRVSRDRLGVAFRLLSLSYGLDGIFSLSLNLILFSLPFSFFLALS